MIVKNKNIRVAFWGSSEFSVHVLNTLQKLSALPELIITTPDKPQGRGLVLTPNIVKSWAIQNNISYLDPTKLKDSFDQINKDHWDLFIVASYGKIMPENILNIPKYKSINIHPSLLPRYRGPSPIQTAILDDSKETGVSIMLMDKEMDHGPVLSFFKKKFDEWAVYEKVEETMAVIGGELIIETIPRWIDGEIVIHEQNHNEATFTHKFEKENGLVDLLNDNPYDIFRKYCAFHVWPNIFFDIEFDQLKKERFKITALQYIESNLKILKVRGQNGKEINFSDLLNQLKGLEKYKNLQLFLPSQ